MSARIALVAISIVLAGLSIREAALSIVTTRPALATTLATAFHPASGVALVAATRARIVAAGGRVDLPTRRLIRAALHRAPAAAPPLVLAALAASAEGDLDRARALMTAAIGRDPRDDAARYWLLDHAIRTGAYAEGLAQVGPSLRLREGTRAAIFALVAALLDTPAGARTVRATLATDPDWRGDFFRQQAPADAAGLAALLLALPRSDDAEQRAVLYAMIDRHRIAQAYAVWRRLLPHGARLTPIYDPDFAGLPGAAPFNWRLQPSDGARAVLIAAPRTALALAFPGAASMVLAEQYAIIAPGRYALSWLSRGEDGPGGATLAIRILCANDARPLVHLPLCAGPRFTSQTTDIVVPACDAIRIQIVGEPGDRMGIVRREVTGLRIAATP